MLGFWLHEELLRYIECKYTDTSPFDVQVRKTHPMKVGKDSGARSGVPVSGSSLKAAETSCKAASPRKSMYCTSEW